MTLEDWAKIRDLHAADRLSVRAIAKRSEVGSLQMV